MTALDRRIAVARGDEPADLVISGGRVLSVFTREWLECDVAVVDGWIAGLGSYDGRERIDAAGRYVVPGFIDAHVHLESSKLLAGEFARLVLPLGTTTVVADPHEIANVLGTDGVHWLLDATEGMPLDVRFTASSCVPASKFESPRRALNEGDLEGLLRRRRVVGLGEMMNFPGVIAGDPAELAKLALAGAERADGHAPGVRGAALQAYAAAGIGSDHESTTIEEGRERLRAGMWLLIREATGARNLHALIPLARELGPHRIALCTDDRDPQHIAADGHVNALVRDAVAEGVDPADAIVMATLNAATWHGLAGLGAVAPAHRADVLVLPDLERFVPEIVLTAGRPPGEIAPAPVPEWVRHTVRIAPLTLGDLRIPWDEGDTARVIGIVPGQIVTESLYRGPDRRRGSCCRRPRARPGQDRRRRAASRHRPDRPGARARARACGTAPSRPPSRTTRTTSSASGSTTATWRGRCSASPSSAAGWWSSATAASGRSSRSRSPACCRTRRSSGCSSRRPPSRPLRSSSAHRSSRRSTPSDSSRSRSSPSSRSPIAA